MNVQLVNMNGTEPNRKTGRIRVDRGRGVYVHKADMKSKDELEGRKWIGGSYSVWKEWTRGRL